MSWGSVGPLDDPVRIFIDWLDNPQLPAMSAFPVEYTPERTTLPLQTVMDDGASESSERHEVVLLQITVWARTRSQARDLAQQSRTRALAHPGSASIGWVRPATRPSPEQDTTTGYWLAAYTIRVHVRAH